MTAYSPRLIDRHIEAMLGELPAILLTGPRAAGKTTSARRHAASIVRLDRPTEATAFAADPDAAIRGMPEPILIDEWQMVPDIIGAVKRTVDDDPRPGRFIVTGSAQADFDGGLWPGTGRLTRIPFYGITIRELTGRIAGPTFLDQVTAGESPRPASDTPDLRGYLELLVRSGFPEPLLRLGPKARDRWLDAYVEQLLTRDIRQIDAGRDRAKLRRYLEAYALSTAGVVKDSTLLEHAAVNRKTALAYQHAFESLLVIDAVPAWRSNRLKRLVVSPKRYIVDAGLAAAVLRVGVDDIFRDGDLLGRLLDTFVVSQLRGELAVAESRPRLHHIREWDGRMEVDLIVELAGGSLIGIEVKADAAPRAADARHLATLRDRYPDRFVVGVLLHTGPRTFPLGDKLVAAPISSLWA